MGASLPDIGLCLFDINLDLLKDGSPSEFFKFYKAYKPKVRGLVNYYGYYLTPEDVDDIMQDTFTKAQKGLPKCRATTEKSLFSWLGTTLRNATYDYVKKKNRKEIIENKAVEKFKKESPHEGDVGDKVVEMGAAEELIRVLKATFNGVLLYEKAILGLTNLELSQKYNCSTSAISQRILREKKKLSSRTDIYALLAS